MRSFNGFRAFSLVVLGVLIIVADVTAVEPSQAVVVAHRGMLQHAPENTLANFRACLELRLGFEFDVQKTKDGILVCIHDESVDRTTDGSGKVSELTLKQIRHLDAGSWFDPKFGNEKVPTIEDVLKLVAEYKQHDVLIAVDLKAEGVEQDVVRIAEKYGVLHRLLFIGSTIADSTVRDHIKQTSSKSHSAAVANIDDEFTMALALSNADWVYFRYLPSAEQISAVHQAGKRAFIAGATVSGDDRDNWQHVAESGIDAILTDYPLELSALLRKDQNK